MPVIERERLLRLFNPSAPITVVIAPSGSGKTTLIQQYTTKISDKSAWHSLNYWDRDYVTLDQNARQCLKLPVAKPTDPYRLGADFARASEQLGDVIYVLDNYQFIQDSAGCGRWLEGVLDTLPSNLRVIISGQMMPDLPIESFVRQDVAVIRQEQLAFTSAEIQQLAEEYSVTVDEAALTSLHGWAAGISMALQNETNALPAAAPEVIFEKLATQLFAQQSQELQSWLLLSATVEVMTPAILTALGITDQIADTLHQGLFVASEPDGHVYHPLFRSFLQKHQQTVDPNQYRHLHLRAADYYGETDRPELAFDHLLVAEAQDRAAALADTIANSYFAQGKNQTLLMLRSQLPVDLAPVLHLHCGIIHLNRNQYDEAVVALHWSQRGLPQTAPEYKRARLTEIWVDFRKGHYQEVIDQLDVLWPLLMDANFQADAQILYGQTLGMLNRAEEGIQRLQAAVRLSETGNYKHTMALALQALEHVCRRAGRYDEALGYLNQSIQIHTALGNTDELGMTYNNLGFLYHQSGDYVRAIETFNAGLNMLATSPDLRTYAYLYWSIGDVYRDCGHFRAAQQMYQLALKKQREEDLHCWLFLSMALSYRWNKQPEQAHTHLRRARQIALDHNIDTECLYANALIEIDTDKPDWDQLQDRAQQLLDRGANMEAATVLGGIASRALDCGEKAVATQVLRKAAQFERIAQGNLLAEIRHTPVLLAYVEQGFATLHQSALELTQVEIDVPATADADQLVWLSAPKTRQLRLYTLGCEVVGLNDCIITSDDWKTDRSREIFWHLVFNQSNHADTLTDLYWPNNVSRTSLYSAIYRIRQVVGTDTVILEDDLYNINPEMTLWIDAVDFETRAKKALLLPPHQAYTEDQLRRAADLYKGAFLPAIYQDWVERRRDYLQQLCLNVLMQLGSSVSTRHGHAEAIEIYSKALEINDLHEATYQALMKCYGELGSREKIVETYQRLVAMFADELAVEPAAETRKLFKRLLER